MKIIAPIFGSVVRRRLSYQSTTSPKTPTTHKSVGQLVREFPVPHRWQILLLVAGLEAKTGRLLNDIRQKYCDQGPNDGMFRQTQVEVLDDLPKKHVELYETILREVTSKGKPFFMGSGRPFAILDEHNNRYSVRLSVDPGPSAVETFKDILRPLQNRVMIKETEIHGCKWMPKVTLIRRMSEDAAHEALRGIRRQYPQGVPLGRVCDFMLYETDHKANYDRLDNRQSSYSNPRDKEFLTKPYSKARFAGVDATMDPIGHEQFGETSKAVFFRIRDHFVLNGPSDQNQHLGKPSIY